VNELNLEQNPWLVELLTRARQNGASDVHLREGSPPWFRQHGQLQAGEPPDGPVSAPQMEGLLDDLLDVSQREQLASRGSYDGAFGCNGFRFRFNIYRASGCHSLAIRLLDSEFRQLSALGLSDDLYQLCQLRDGLILVSGPTGAGKSTTLATLLHRINETRPCHIVTIEDPVEYLHVSRCALVHQRQVGMDTSDFPQALIDAVRQDPDVILVGELRDLPTIRTALMAAETGHLVFASVHAGDSIGTIERIASAFPAAEQPMALQLLSTTLRAIITQHLLIAEPAAALTDRIGSDPRPSRNRVLASEVLIVNSAIANLVAANNLVQIRSVLETSRSGGMYTLDHSLAQLCRRKLVSEQAARSVARNPGLLADQSRLIAPRSRTVLKGARG
jgi:twitching motility protein PilT